MNVVDCFCTIIETGDKLTLHGGGGASAAMSTVKHFWGKTLPEVEATYTVNVDGYHLFEVTVKPKQITVPDTQWDVIARGESGTDSKGNWKRVWNYADKTIEQRWMSKEEKASWKRS